MTPLTTLLVCRCVQVGMLACGCCKKQQRTSCGRKPTTRKSNDDRLNKHKKKPKPVMIGPGRRLFPQAEMQLPLQLCSIRRASSLCCEYSSQDLFGKIFGSQ